MERGALRRDSDGNTSIGQSARQLRTLRAHVCAQGLVLQALLMTHPKRNLVAEEFRAESLRHLGTLCSSGPLESGDAFDRARRHWLTLIDEV